MATSSSTASPRRPTPKSISHPRSWRRLSTMAPRLQTRCRSAPTTARNGAAGQSFTAFYSVPPSFTFSSFSVVVGGSYYSNSVNGINDSGIVAGNYYLFSPESGGHGFVYDGTNYTTLDYPAASNTVATGINSAGQVVGYYTGNHGFLYSHGSYTPVNYPLTASTTQPRAINDSGQIVGTYFDSNNKEHGFLDSGGTF